MLFAYLVVLSVCAALGACTPLTVLTPKFCIFPRQRVEWRDLAWWDRQSYIKAVLCLKTKPSRIGLRTSLFDDFPYVHNQLNNDVHAVANFLPWHRYFVQIYEEALQSCGYNGVATYWDWTRDTANVTRSPIWDASTGIGGNGSPSKTETVNGVSLRCVTDGPFKNLRPSYYSGVQQDHCLARQWNNGTAEPGDMLAPKYSTKRVSEIQGVDEYNVYRFLLEADPHGSIHLATGGDLGPGTSPNDPLFFLHHTQVDRLWWLWQSKKQSRWNEYSGPKTQDLGDGVTPANATVEDILPMLGLAEDLKVKEFLRTTSSRLCYKY